MFVLLTSERADQILGPSQAILTVYECFTATDCEPQTRQPPGIVANISTKFPDLPDRRSRFIKLEELVQRCPLLQARCKTERHKGLYLLFFGRLETNISDLPVFITLNLD